MNHVDRARLSQLLTDIDDHCDNLGLGYGLLQQAIDEARAIIDQPAGIITINGSLANTAEIHRALRKAFAETGTDGKYTILNEPLHEYRDHIPTRRRHRALHPLKLATALTLAAIGLIAATALTTTPSSTQGPRQHSVAPNTPPEAAQHARGGYTYPPRTP